jgi:hypothetical protein
MLSPYFTRQGHDEAGPPFRSGDNLYRSAMFIDNPLANRKSQAVTAAGSFGRIEGFEDSFSRGRINTAAIVTYQQAQSTFILSRR